MTSVCHCHWISVVPGPSKACCMYSGLCQIRIYFFSADSLELFSFCIVETENILVCLDVDGFQIGRFESGEVNCMYKQCLAKNLHVLTPTAFPRTPRGPSSWYLVWSILKAYASVFTRVFPKVPFSINLEEWRWKQDHINPASCSLPNWTEARAVLDMCGVQVGPGSSEYGSEFLDNSEYYRNHTPIFATLICLLNSKFTYCERESLLLSISN